MCLLCLSPPPTFSQLQFPPPPSRRHHLAATLSFPELHSLLYQFRVLKLIFFLKHSTCSMGDFNTTASYKSPFSALISNMVAGKLRRSDFFLTLDLLRWLQRRRDSTDRVQILTSGRPLLRSPKRFFPMTTQSKTTSRKRKDFDRKFRALEEQGGVLLHTPDWKLMKKDYLMQAPAKYQNRRLQLQFLSIMGICCH